MSSIAFIPSRFASTRLPGKPLKDIGGKSMIQRVYERACLSKLLEKVVVATDDQRIYDHVVGFGGEVVLTDPSHQSGTERCAEALTKVDGVYDVVLNIQGDEPFIDPAQIDQLIGCFESPNTDIATLIMRINSTEELFNENRPKVIFNQSGEAIYFSRASIPYARGVEKAGWLGQGNFYKHIGVYAYGADVLATIVKLPPSNLEKLEQLEQLRWLEAGYVIKVTETEYESLSVDTSEDLDAARKYLADNSLD